MTDNVHNKSNLTIADISKETGIAESTLRFYRDKLGHYIPSLGEGRKRRYEPQAIEIFKEISTLSNQGFPFADIEQHLSETYAHNPIIVLDEIRNATTAVEPQFAVTAIKPQTATNAVTAIEPQYIISLLELLKSTPQKEPEKLYCTAKEAAIRTGFSQDFIKKCCREYLQSRKGIPCVRTGRGYVIHKGLLDEWFTKMIGS